MKWFETISSNGVTTAYLSNNGWFIFTGAFFTLGILLFFALVYFENKQPEGSHDNNGSSFVLSMGISLLVIHLCMTLIFNVNLSKAGAEEQLKKALVQNERNN